jgi:hypothetical protein
MPFSAGSSEIGPYNVPNRALYMHHSKELEIGD